MRDSGDSFLAKEPAYESGARRRPLSPHGAQVLTRACANILLFALLLFLTPAEGEERPTAALGATTLTVEMTGALPGFSAAAASQYLASEMGQAGVAGWTFVPTPASAQPAPDRIEWHIEQSPYAGGSVRQFIPIPSVQRLFGTHHNISVEVRLYLRGQYQTLALGETVVQGGPPDKALAAFVTKLTQDLLGEHGAYRSIDKSSSPNTSTKSNSPP
jgi:hypothetical protein